MFRRLVPANRAADAIAALGRVNEGARIQRRGVPAVVRWTCSGDRQMTTHTIPLRSMRTDGCETFLSQLVTQPDASRYRIDCAGLGHISPFGMLMCSYALVQFRTKHPECAFEVVNHEKQTYAGHMGFFRAFGADFGRAPGEALGSAHYIPVTLIGVDAIRRDARDNMMAVQSWLEREASRLAGMLVQHATYEVRRALVFSLTEVLRNIVEHSQATQMGYCAQYWPSSDVVEVGILDSGIGVAASLSRNPFWNIQSESHALHLALLPGVSGTAYEGAPRDKDDVWANAGFGLYMASSICRDAGNFLISSGTSCVELQGAKKISRHLPIGGTAVRLRVQLSKLAQVEERRGEIIRKGDELASKLRGTVPNPTAASKMVRETGEYSVGT